MAGGGPPSISVVVPVYGCVACLGELCARLDRVLSSITDRHEIVLVDDRSPDGGWAAIVALQEKYPNVVGVRLSRNFGQHIAISAGLEVARGDYVVVMDCDLQDPPERIPDLVDKANEGFDVVLARRVERNHSLFRIVGARMYFALVSRLTQEGVDGAYGSFSLLKRNVVDAFLRFSERERHYLFIVRWLGFNVTSIEYPHEPRAEGHSSYSIWRLIGHAAGGLFFQETVFLRWIVGAGLMFGIFGGMYGAYHVFRYLAHGAAVPGWTSIMVMLSISTGAILVSLGVIGLYVGRIFEQTKARPLYIVDRLNERISRW